MLSRCANAKCSKPFLRLREGKLFLVETHGADADIGMQSLQFRHQSRHVERYWLCDQCATEWTLAYDRHQGVALLPLRRPAVGTALGMKQALAESA